MVDKQEKTKGEEMKLERFRSDWNGQESNVAYHKIPSTKLVKEAIKDGKAYFGNCMVFASENIVEVKTRISNGIPSGNIYRDLYRIVK